MLPNVDPAILSALHLEATSSKLLSHGGSGFSSTYKLVATKDGKELTYFVKTGIGPDAEIMFKGEHASLNAIHSTVPSFCPKAYAHGPLSSSSSSPTGPSSGSSSGKFFLATDFLDLRSSASPGTGLSLAAKLAKLHTTPAPTQKGFSRPMFGFPVPTCCGSTVQDNSWKETWAEFYADNRLRGILKECIRKNGSDKELSDQVDKTASTVVPRLLGEDHLKGLVIPVVVHGDLWSGNHGRGRIAGSRGVEEVVFDPSCCYGHSEYDLGIMKMFGGFGGSFWKEYEKLVPKTEPKEEFEDRVALYELYHHLNHFALFGGGYRGSAMSIMKRLINMYG